MTTIYPSDPCFPPHGIAKTARECRLEKLASAALPYLIAQQMDDTGDKLTELVEAIARETA